MHVGRTGNWGNNRRSAGAEAAAAAKAPLRPPAKASPNIRPAGVDQPIGPIAEPVSQQQQQHTASLLGLPSNLRGPASLKSTDADSNQFVADNQLFARSDNLGLLEGPPPGSGWNNKPSSGRGEFEAPAYAPGLFWPPSYEDAPAPVPEAAFYPQPPQAQYDSRNNNNGWEESLWDSPIEDGASNTGNIFSLGDIRQAEKVIESQGMNPEMYVSMETMRVLGRAETPSQPPPLTPNKHRLILGQESDPLGAAHIDHQNIFYGDQVRIEN